MCRCILLMVIVHLVIGGRAGAADADLDPRDGHMGERSVVSWVLDDSQDGWHPNSHIEGFAREQDARSGISVGSDPIFYGPRIQLAATPFQMIEIELQTDSTGIVEILWANTEQTPYDGFRPNGLLLRHWPVTTTARTGLFHSGRMRRPSSSSG